MEALEIRNDQVVYRCGCCNGSGQTEGPKVRFLNRGTFETLRDIQRNWLEAERQSYDDWAEKQKLPWIQRGSLYNTGPQDMVISAAIILAIVAVYYFVPYQTSVPGYIFALVFVAGEIFWLPGWLHRWRTAGPKARWEKRKRDLRTGYRDHLYGLASIVTEPERVVLAKRYIELFEENPISGRLPLSKNTVVVMPRGAVATSDCDDSTKEKAPQV
jgi:hypothetical protein